MLHFLRLNLSTPLSDVFFFASVSDCCRRVLTLQKNFPPQRCELSLRDQKHTDAGGDPQQWRYALTEGVEENTGDAVSLSLFK